MEQDRVIGSKAEDGNEMRGETDRDYGKVQ